MNMSPTMPTRTRKPPAVPRGFLAPKPKPRTIAQMTIRELHDLQDRNARKLADPGASSSAFVQRLTTEQIVIRRRLAELGGVDDLQEAFRTAGIRDEDDMQMDIELPTYPIAASRMTQAKQKALASFAADAPINFKGSLSAEEADALEQRGHALDAERRLRNTEKMKKQGLPINGEVLTPAEQEARIWAFMTYKPTESDLEDDDDESIDPDDDNPANWFEDDQDDGRKCQDIIDPDVEDMSDIIRVDYSRIPQDTFNQPRRPGD